MVPSCPVTPSDKVLKGWARGDAWADVTFLAEHDADIAKIAIVGAERWREEVLDQVSDSGPGRGCRYPSG